MRHCAATKSASHVSVAPSTGVHISRCGNWWQLLCRLLFAAVVANCLASRYFHCLLLSTLLSFVEFRRAASREQARKFKAEYVFKLLERSSTPPRFLPHYTYRISKYTTAESKNTPLSYGWNRLWRPWKPALLLWRWEHLGCSHSYSCTSYSSCTFYSPPSCSSAPTHPRICSHIQCYPEASAGSHGYWNAFLAVAFLAVETDTDTDGASVIVWRQVQSRKWPNS